MKRRSFIKNSSLTAMSMSAFGIIEWDGKNYVGDTPTTTDILGPFYRPGAPMRSNIIPSGSKGMPLKLTGHVFKHDGKSALDNVLIEIWQCDENEYYDNTSDAFLFRGGVKTDKNGRYAFKTIIPVPYKANPDNEASWRPAHIHMRVSSPDQQDLITQIYFKGDKYLDKDSSSSNPLATHRILEITKNSLNENVVTFDILMSKEFPLDASVYKKITGIYNMNDNIAEFTKKDDLLFMKWKGFLQHSLAYRGNNTFEGGLGYPKAKFELLPDGTTNATITFRNSTFSGKKFLKYSE